MEVHDVQIMADKLTKKENEFVQAYVENNNNATQAVKEVFGIEDDNYAGVKGHRLISKAKIKDKLLSLADRIPDDLLGKVHLEGLEAGEPIMKEGIEVGYAPDYAVRHKYLDSAYKLKGAYAPEKTLNLNVDVDVSDPQAQELAREFEERLKKTDL